MSVGINKGVIVDVDGTLAIMNGRGPFEWTKVYQDMVNEPVADLVRRLKTSGLSVIIVTGRDGVALEDTKKWLNDNSIPFDAIFSRPARNSSISLIPCWISSRAPSKF